MPDVPEEPSRSVTLAREHSVGKESHTHKRSSFAASIRSQLKRFWSEGPRTHEAQRGSALVLTDRDMGLAGGLSVTEWLCREEASGVTEVDLAGNDLTANGTTARFFLSMRSVLVAERTNLRSLRVLNLGGTRMHDDGLLLLVDGLVKCVCAPCAGGEACACEGCTVRCSKNRREPPCQDMSIRMTRIMRMITAASTNVHATAAASTGDPG